MKSFMLIILLIGLHYGTTQSNLQKIPEAPRLPDLDYNSLPEFIRKYLPTEKPISNIESNRARSKENEKSFPKTYGMKLNNGDGIIWNDLLPARMSYQIGENKAITEEPGKDIDDIIDDWLNRVENHSPKPEDTTKIIEETTSTQVRTTPKTEKYFRTTETPKTTSEPKQETNEKDLLNTIGSKLDDIIIKDINKFMKIPDKNEPGSKINDTANENTDGDRKISEGNAPNTDNDIAKNIIKSTTARADQKPDLPYILELLIQNDELWQWLSDSITKYLESLIGRIGALIQEEVELLLQECFESHDCGCKANNNSRHDVNGNDDKKPDLNEDENNQKNSTSVAKLIPKPEKFDAEKNDSNANKDSVDSGSKNDTVDDISKHNKDKHPDPNKGDNKPEKQKSHENSIIYGNSVGNERVTNVFIFHMKSESQPSIISNNSSGSYSIDLSTDPSNVKDKNKPNQNNTEAETVSTESTKIPIDTDESDKETTEYATEDNVSKDSDETTQTTVDMNEDSKEATTESMTNEKLEDLEDTEDNASKNEEKESAEGANDETKVTEETTTEACSTEDAEE